MLARKTDPRSSHEAAAGMIASGARTAQQAQALAAVKAHPGCTSHELAERSGMDRYALARRLPECEGVKKGEIRRCTVSGRSAVTWVLA